MPGAFAEIEGYMLMECKIRLFVIMVILICYSGQNVHRDTFEGLNNICTSDTTVMMCTFILQLYFNCKCISIVRNLLFGSTLFVRIGKIYKSYVLSCICETDYFRLTIMIVEYSNLNPAELNLINDKPCHHITEKTDHRVNIKHVGQTNRQDGSLC